MGDGYLVVYVSEDGDVSLSTLTAEELRQSLRDNYWGDAVFLPHVRSDATVHDLAAKSGLRIIKGEQITPTPKTVATDWDL